MISVSQLAKEGHNVVISADESYIEYKDEDGNVQRRRLDTATDVFVFDMRSPCER